MPLVWSYFQRLGRGRTRRNHQGWRYNPVASDLGRLARHFSSPDHFSQAPMPPALRSFAPASSATTSNGTLYRLAS